MLERGVLPVFAPGDALRAPRLAHRRLRARVTPLALGCLCLAATIAVRPLPRLVWNASASAPVGLYRVTPDVPLLRGDMVIARTPSGVRDLAARRHYIPANVPLVKHVAGIAGDRICAVGAAITINGWLVATRRVADAHGRALPRWHGCRRLDRRTLFLLMTANPDSFDGRYFGPTPTADVIGKAVLLWAR